MHAEPSPRARWSARPGRPRRTALGLLCAALVASACGGGGSGDPAGSGADGSGGASDREGGRITILATSFPDFLDPGLAYTVDAWQALSNVYPGLMTFPHTDGKAGAEVVPGLAEAMPEISNGDRTYTFTLREGLSYSDGTPVKASDYEGVVRRALAQDSSGAGFYLPIEGAERFLEEKRGDISGIETDDAARKVEITLTEPRGAFLYELAVPFSGFVPGATPAENQTKRPPPGAGRYVIRDVKVNRSYTLVKNPGFSASLKGTAVDSGHLDQMEVEVDRSPANQATKVMQGKADFMVDIPPADRLGEIEQRAASRFHEFPTNSTYFFFLNSEVAPFDDLRVRQAVNHAVDVKALNRIQANTLTPAHSVLPPGVAGHERTADLYPYDLGRARDLVRRAGAEGAAVTVWGNADDPTKSTIEYYTDVLNSIGLKAQAKLISAETYFATIGNRATRAQTGWANWVQDYPHPANFIDVLFNPGRVVESGNTNFAYNAADRELGARVDRLTAEPRLTDEVRAGWAAVDEEIQRKAYGAIYGNRKQTTFMSERMDFEHCRGESVTVTHDWSRFCLR